VPIALAPYMVALESDDLHREWVLGRCTTIRKLGYKFNRAYGFLVDV
jgi:hypothetical protein